MASVFHPVIQRDSEQVCPVGSQPITPWWGMGILYPTAGSDRRHRDRNRNPGPPDDPKVRWSKHHRDRARSVFGGEALSNVQGPPWPEQLCLVRQDARTWAEGVAEPFCGMVNVNTTQVQPTNVTDPIRARQLRALQVRRSSALRRGSCCRTAPSPDVSGGSGDGGQPHHLGPGMVAGTTDPYHVQNG